MKKTVTLLSIGLLSGAAYARDTGIQCYLDSAGEHLAFQSSSLGRGVDMINEKGVSFYAYIDGRADRRVFKVEAYDTASDTLIAARTAPYFNPTPAYLTLEVGNLSFDCWMQR